MTDRTLTLTSAAGTIEFNTDSVAAEGFCALRPLPGIGLPAVDSRWAKSAGNGAVYEGESMEPRDIPLSMRVNAANETQLLSRLSTLAKILAPTNSPHWLAWTVGGETWRLRVRRISGGDWAFGDFASTNGVTYVRTTPIVLRAGDPLWARSTADQVVLRADDSGAGLLSGGSLSELNLSSSQVIGDVLINNTGDAETFPLVRLDGPATAFQGTAPDGQTLTWEGELEAGDVRIFDHATKTVVDGDGVNCYDELGPVPRFWAVAPGQHVTQFSAEGTTVDSKLTISWLPRRHGVV